LFMNPSRFIGNKSVLNPLDRVNPRSIFRFLTIRKYDIISFLLLINYFFEKSLVDLCSGVRLNKSEDTPYIKKRLSGRGGYRVYFLLMIRQDNVYLMFVHPKTGSEGSENITDESKAFLYKKVLKCIKSNDLYHLTLNNNKDKIIYKRTIGF
ncbi:MAG TPA: hypothetical protein DCL77_04270, partial [Prolixibacteraceae bacterium]|nr:hypothetical protein [Prolixibacteraceae bacterium]